MMVDIILNGESANIEFKESRPAKSTKYMKTVIAFANGKGGRLIFGVEDDTRRIKGIPEEIVFKEIDAIANAISDSCEPMIIPDIYPQTVEGQTLIIVEIPQGKQKPYYIKSEGMTEGVYVRVSGTTRKADRIMSREMYFESEGRSYDSIIRRDVDISDDDIDAFCRQLKDIALSNCTNDEQRANIKNVTKNVLLSWGILADDASGKIYPTNAYIFLTGSDPFHSRIQCGIFKGDTRAIFVDKQEFDGPLWKQVDDSFKYVLRNIHMGARFEGIYRKDIYELPPDSLRELIINAVMNCSFIQSSLIQVALYDDRLEITSPGGLMPGVTIDRMKTGYSQIRNKAIAHAFAYMNLIEGWGTGIPRLMHEMKEYGLREPEFIDMGVALRINLYRDDNCPANHGKKKAEASAVVRENTEDVLQGFRRRSEDIPKMLTHQQKTAYIAITENGEITTKTLSEILDVSDRRARKILSDMIGLGIVRRIGATTNSKYVLAEELHH